MASHEPDDVDFLLRNGGFQAALQDGSLDYLTNARAHTSYNDRIVDFDEGDWAGSNPPNKIPGATGGKRASKIILIPPSPHTLMRDEARQLARTHGSLHPHDVGSTPPTIMLTPASNPSTAVGSPNHSVRSSSPQPEMTSQTRRTDQQNSSARRSDWTAPSYSPNPASPRESRSPGPGRQFRVKMSPGLQAMFKNRPSSTGSTNTVQQGTSENAFSSTSPADPSSIDQLVGQRVEGTDSGALKSDLVSGAQANPAIRAPPRDTSAATTKGSPQPQPPRLIQRESTSSVDSLPFGVTSTVLPSVPAPFDPYLQFTSAPAGPSTDTFLPTTLPSAPLTRPPLPRSISEAASEIQSLQMRDQSFTGLSSTDRQPTLPRYEAVSSHRNEFVDEKDFSHAIDDLPHQPVMPTAVHRDPERVEVDDILEEMGLSPKISKTERYVMTARNGVEFVMEEHGLSPVSERTELSSIKSSRRSHRAGDVQRALAERFIPTQGFLPQAPRAPSAPNPTPSQRIRGNSLNGPSSNGRPSYSSDDTRSIHRTETRNNTEPSRFTTTQTLTSAAQQVMTAYRDGSKCPESPTKRNSSPTKGTPRSIKRLDSNSALGRASSFASTLGDIEILRRGPIWYLNADSPSMPAKWLECSGILTPETLYLALGPAFGDTMEFMLQNCIIEPAGADPLPHGEDGRMRAMQLRWRDGRTELMATKKAKARTAWADAIGSAIKNLNRFVDSPEALSSPVDTSLEQRLMQRASPVTPTPQPPRKSSTSESSEVTPGGSGSSPTLRTEFRRELDADDAPPLDYSDHLYNERAHQLKNVLRGIEGRPHSTGATQQSAASIDDLAKTTDLLSQLGRFQYGTDAAGLGTPKGSKSDKGKQKAHVGVELQRRAGGAVKHRRNDSDSSSNTSVNIEPMSPGLSMAHELRRLRSAVERKHTITVPDAAASQMFGHLKNIHQLIEGVSHKLRGHELERESGHAHEEPTIADKVDYMLSLCNILLESQHKVSAAVERNLKAHGVAVDGKQPQSTLSSMKGQKAISPVDMNSASRNNEVDSSGTVVKEAKEELQDAGLQRIEQTLAIIMAKLELRDHQNASSFGESPPHAIQCTKHAYLAHANGDQHGTREEDDDFSPPTRPHTVGEGVRFSEPNYLASPTATDVQSIMDIEADVALWKQRERGLPLSQIGNWRVDDYAKGNDDRSDAVIIGTRTAEKIAKDRARAERVLEGYRSPNQPNLEINKLPEISKWSGTTSRDPSPTAKGNAGDRGATALWTESAILNDVAEGPTFSPSTAPPSVLSRKHRGSLPTTIAKVVEETLARHASAQAKLQPESSANAHPHPVMEETLRVLRHQEELTQQQSAHHIDVGQYLARLNHFWEHDILRRDADSHNLAEALSKLQDQMTVLAERIVDGIAAPIPAPAPAPALAVPAASPSLAPATVTASAPTPVQEPNTLPTVETGVPTNNASSDNLSVLAPALLKKTSFLVEALSDEPAKSEKRPWTPNPRLTKAKKSTPPKTSASKPRKLDYGKSFLALDLGSKLSSVGRLWGGPTPVADREARWGKGSSALDKKGSSAPTRKGSLKRSNSKNKKNGLDGLDLNAILGLNLDDLATQDVFSKQKGKGSSAGMANILGALRSQKASEDARRKEEEKLKANMPTDPSELAIRRAQIEELQQLRTAQEAHDKAKVLETTVTAYRDQLQESEKEIKTLQSALEAHRNPDKQAETTALEERMKKLKEEEHHMLSLLRQLNAVAETKQVPNTAGVGRASGSEGRTASGPHEGPHPNDMWADDHYHDSHNTAAYDEGGGHYGHVYGDQEYDYDQQGDAYGAYTDHTGYYPDHHGNYPATETDYDHHYPIHA